jgi:peptide-methionine (S)-S-oxide reductase
MKTMNRNLFQICLLLFCSFLCVSTAVAGQKETATFAGGCFWCMEQPFDSLPGVISVMPGYTGGAKLNPTYKEVSAGSTGHTEAVQISYDPAKISYEKLLQVFWRNIDPTVTDRQFCDIGNQYRAGIFYHTEAQKKMALLSRETISKTRSFKEPVVTEIVQASTFYLAEEYHRQYYKKNPLRYRYYRSRCGRDNRLKDLWGSNAGH